MKRLVRPSWSSVHQMSNNDRFPGFCFAVAKNVGRSSRRTASDCVAFKSIDGDTLYFTEVSWMDALEAIRSRRSVRSYTGDPISRDDLQKIVDAGRLAASGYNRQPWDFIVVTERGMISKLAVAAEWMDKAAAVIAVVIDPSAEFWLEDGSAAVENMLVACTALGYGSCWLEGDTLPLEDRLKVVLGIPKEKRLLTLVPVGVPAEWPTKEKKPLDEVIHWEKW